MKYLKTFEQNKHNLEIDDYAILNITAPMPLTLNGIWAQGPAKIVKEFISKNPGKIKNINPSFTHNGILIYSVQYKNIPNIIKKYFKNSCRDFLEFEFEVKYSSKNEEDIQLYIDMNNYNL